MTFLVDAMGRRFNYVRLSITQACNYSCQYCLPNGFKKQCDTNFLSRTEIFNLVYALGQLGISKIRLTGGEPMVRNDLIDIIKDIRSVENIKTVALTTNGYKLDKVANDLINAGLDAINISLDSLDASKFHKITGKDKFQNVFSGLQAMNCADSIKVKLNAVLLKGINDDELPQFLELIKTRNISVRFIELMRTGDNKEYFDAHHIAPTKIIDFIENIGFKKAARLSNQGPANEYSHNDYRGKIGVIAPYSNDFCANCNRLRIDAFGNLKLCLFGNGGINLRPLLLDIRQTDELQSQIIQSLNLKPKAHDLAAGYTGSTAHLAQIGG